MPNALETLRGLGYSVEAASGVVSAEEDALDEARTGSTPAVIEGQAQTVTSMTMQDLADEGRLPAGRAKRRELAERIAATAIAHLTERAAGLVEFHERALEIATASPTVYVVNGDGFANVYVAIDDATGEPAEKSGRDVVASLADPAAIAERRWQHRLNANPRGDDIREALFRIRRKGYTVTVELQPDGSGLQAHIVGPAVDQTVTTLAQARTAARDLPQIEGKP